MRRWALLITLCLALIVSIGFNVVQAKRNEAVVWLSEHFDGKIKEFSIGHELLTNDTFFGDAKRSFIAIQVQFICNQHSFDTSDLIASVRVWDRLNIGRADLENNRKDVNSIKLSQNDKHIVRARSYETDILPVVKNSVHSSCGKKGETAFISLQKFILNASIQ